MSEERPFEQALLLKHAVDVSGVKFALISLDFLRYVGGGGRTDFLPKTWSRWHGVGDYLKTLVSYTTLTDSVATVVASRSRRKALQHGPDGLLNVAEFERPTAFQVRQQFDAVDAVYLNRAYAPALGAREALRRGGFDHRPLHDMLATAHGAGVRLYFFITPAHARQFEIIHMLGLAPLYRQWISALSCELARDAGRAPGAAPFPLWDFSGYNSVNTEPVPAPGTEAPMRWYSDPVHYKPAAGRLVEDRVLDLAADGLAAVEDFGVKLTPGLLAAHFKAMTRGRRAYLAAHPDFLAGLQSLYHGVPRTLEAAGDGGTPNACRPED